MYTAFLDLFAAYGSYTNGSYTNYKRESKDTQKNKDSTLFEGYHRTMYTRPVPGAAL